MCDFFIVEESRLHGSRWHNYCSCCLMEITSAALKYEQLISTATAAGVMNLHVREFNNILYIDGHVPSEEVKVHLWHIFQQIDPGYRSGDLVLNLR